MIAGVSPNVVVPHPGVLGAIVAGAASGRRRRVGVGQGNRQHVLARRAYRTTSAILSGDTSSNVDQSKRFVSPVGVAGVATDAVRAGWVSVFGLLIAINIFVGLFNLLPLLPFDGGHIAIALYEMVASTVRRRRVRVDVAKLLPITVAVVAVLGFIFLSSLFLDIAHPNREPVLTRGVGLRPALALFGFGAYVDCFRRDGGERSAEHTFARAGGLDLGCCRRLRELGEHVDERLPFDAFGVDSFAQLGADLPRGDSRPTPDRCACRGPWRAGAER